MFNPGITVLQGGTMSISILTASQARSKDSLGRVSLQGYLGTTEEGKGKKKARVVHEYSILRALKASSKAGEYAWKGVLVLDVDENGREHVSNGVKYVRHNARVLRGSISQFVEIPKVPAGSMPF